MLAFKSEVVTDHKLSNSPLIPSLMPDELFQSFYGRLINLNGFENATLANLTLNEAIHDFDSNLKNLHAIFKVAKMAGVSVEEFIHRHTLIAVMRSPISIYTKQNHDIKVVNKLISRLPKKGFHFCPSCVSEDMDYLGFSFWRKSHQFVGVDWCSKHELTLCVTFAKDALYKQPAKIFTENKYYETNINIFDRENEYVRKFNELYQDYCDGKLKINATVAAEYLKEKARALNLRICINGTRKNLSDLLIESYPMDWIKTHFPDLIKFNHGKYVSSFDSVTKGRANGKISSIFLAAAVLGVGDNRLLSKLTSNNQLNMHNNEITDKELVDSFISNGGILFKMENQLGINSSLIARKLNALGYPALKNLNKSTVIALKSFYQGASFEQLSKIKGVNMNEFLNTLRICSFNLGKVLNQIV